MKAICLPKSFIQTKSHRDIRGVRLAREPFYLHPTLQLNPQAVSSTPEWVEHNDDVATNGSRRGRINRGPYGGLLARQSRSTCHCHRTLPKTTHQRTRHRHSHSRRHCNAKDPMDGGCRVSQNDADGGNELCSRRWPSLGDNQSNWKP